MEMVPNSDYIDFATIILSDASYNENNWVVRKVHYLQNEQDVWFGVLIYNNPILYEGQDVFEFTDEGGDYSGINYNPITKYSGYIYKFFSYMMFPAHMLIASGLLSQDKVYEIFEETTPPVSIGQYDGPEMQTALMKIFRGEKATGSYGIIGVPVQDFCPEEAEYGKDPETEKLFNKLYIMQSFTPNAKAIWAFSDNAGSTSSSWFNVSVNKPNINLKARITALADKTLLNICPQPFMGFVGFNRPGASGIGQYICYYTLIGVEMKEKTDGKV